MPRWLVKLEGTPFDLEDFPHWFPRGEMFSTADADGTYLVGAELEACKDSASVHQAAEVMLDEMHAIICLLEPTIRRPTIGAVLREDESGKRTGVAYLAGTIGGRSKARATLSVAGANSTASTETQAQLLLKVAQADRNLRIALSLLAMPHVSWPHLYRALEEIEVFLGQKAHSAGLCSSDERERFTRSANSGEIAGKDSRHRIGKFEPPPQPMTLHAAQSFIRSCLDATLRRAASAA